MVCRHGDAAQPLFEICQKLLRGLWDRSEVRLIVAGSWRGGCHQWIDTLELIAFFSFAKTRRRRRRR